MAERMRAEETVFAVASGAGRAAVTLLRLSGPDSRGILATLAGAVPPPRRASVRALRHEGRLLDRAMVLWLPGPHSYTGEDSAELHLHGGGAVLAAVGEALLACGAKPAAAGEFTRRAVQHGRMDLTSAEGIADLVAAETEAQRAQALRQMDGELGEVYRGWSARLLALLAQMEALIDFPDEDLPAEIQAAADAEIAGLHGAICAHLDDRRRGERLRDGLVFAVVGAPNAGKSTLVNRLAGREVSIVADTPGTTRDVLEARVVLGGVPVTLLDTAGLREAAEPVEAEGIRRALLRAEQADAVILVSDMSAVSPDALPEPTRVDMVRVGTKADLGTASWAGTLAVSAKTGAGLAELQAHLAALAQSLTQASGPPALTRARHRHALQSAADRLSDARSAGLAELRTEDLRLAMRALGSITGEVGVENVLDSVFGQFCIGK